MRYQHATVPQTTGAGKTRLVFRPNGTHALYVSLTGSLANITMSHIHTANATSNGPIRVALLPFLKAPPAAIVNPPLSYSGKFDFITQFDSSALPGWFNSSTFLNPTPAAAEAALLDLLKKDLLYVNIHTVAYGGGEIRAQLSCKLRDCKAQS